MSDICKKAADNLYSEIKSDLDNRFESYMNEINELPSGLGVYGLYANNFISSLVRFSANKMPQYNSKIQEILHVPDELFGTYEQTFQHIRRIQESELELAKNLAIHENNYKKALEKRTLFDEDCKNRLQLKYQKKRKMRKIFRKRAINDIIENNNASGQGDGKL